MIGKLSRQGRNNELLWRYGFNVLPSLRYRFGSGNGSNDATQSIISRLNRDGIAITSVDELLGNKKAFEELELAVEELLAGRSDEIREMKLKANDVNSIGDKTFNIEMLGSNVAFDPDSIFARFALEDALLNIANSYFGMLVKLRYYNFWYTFSTSGAARESQLWHFDREDNYILKVFLYLKDVDEGTGPFTYAPETHRKGRFWGQQPEYAMENGVRRSTDEQMSAVVPSREWIKGIGKKGTIIFADTRGFHKGGEARTGDRLMYTCMYTSPASDSRRLLEFRNDASLRCLSKRQLCALEIK